MGILDLALIEPFLTGDPDRNFQRGAAGVRQALDAGASLIVLPELWVTGFARTRITSFLEGGATYGIEEIRKIEAECRQRGADLVFGFPQPTDGQDYFNALNLPTHSQPREYRKLMVYTDVEKNFVPAKCEPGNLLAFTHVNPRNETFVIAVQLCADLRFPEIARAGGQVGASLILNCSQWRARARLDDVGPAYPEHWECLLQARAIENQVYVAGCGAQGTAFAYDLHGNSVVYDPVGIQVKASTDSSINREPDAGRVITFHLDMSRTGVAADAQAPHFIPWIEEMTPIIERVAHDTRAFLGQAARQPRTGSRQYDIFLSYYAADDTPARELVSKAEESGLGVFFAPKSLQFGTDFSQDIRRALIESGELWILMTPGALGSEWVITEWGAAWALNKPIVPILLQVSPTQLPDRLKSVHALDYHKADQLIAQALGRRGRSRAGS